MVAGVAAIAVGGAGAENLAFVFFLVGVAAKVIFFFEQQPVFAFEEIGGGKACDSAADDDDVSFSGSVGFGKRVAVADLVANAEVFTFDERRCRGAAGLFEEGFVDRATGGDGSGNDVLDEIAA